METDWTKAVNEMSMAQGQIDNLKKRLESSPFFSDEMKAKLDELSTMTMSAAGGFRARMAAATAAQPDGEDATER